MKKRDKIHPWNFNNIAWYTAKHPRKFDIAAAYYAAVDYAWLDCRIDDQRTWRFDVRHNAAAKLVSYFRLCLVLTAKKFKMLDIYEQNNNNKTSNVIHKLFFFLFAFSFLVYGKREKEMSTSTDLRTRYYTDGSNGFPAEMLMQIFHAGPGISNTSTNAMRTRGWLVEKTTTNPTTGEVHRDARPVLKTPADLRKLLADAKTSRVEFGAMYTSGGDAWTRPLKSSKQYFANNNNDKWTKHACELRIDIDISSDDSLLRVCCPPSEKNLCDKCWILAVASAVYCNHLLVDILKCKHVMWVFSGRRGFHAFVFDEAWTRASRAERERVVGLYQRMTTYTSALIGVVDANHSIFSGTTRKRGADLGLSSSSSSSSSSRDNTNVQDVYSRAATVETDLVQLHSQWIDVITPIIDHYISLDPPVFRASQPRLPRVALFEMLANAEFRPSESSSTAKNAKFRILARHVDKLPRRDVYSPIFTKCANVTFHLAEGISSTHFSKQSLLAACRKMTIESIICAVETIPYIHNVLRSLVLELAPTRVIIDAAIECLASTRIGSEFSQTPRQIVYARLAALMIVPCDKPVTLQSEHMIKVPFQIHPSTQLLGVIYPLATDPLFWSHGLYRKPSMDTINSQTQTQTQTQLSSTIHYPPTSTDYTHTLAPYLVMLDAFASSLATWRSTTNIVAIPSTTTTTTTTHPVDPKDVFHILRHLVR